MHGSDVPDGENVSISSKESTPEKNQWKLNVTCVFFFIIIISTEYAYIFERQLKM